MGLFVITDAYKPSWIESVYGDKEVTNLYKCDDNAFLTLDGAEYCVNENENVSNTEWIDFLTNLNNAQTTEEIETIFDVDSFITDMVIDYLTGGWDHFMHIGHNYYMYKQLNGKWKYLSYDFDHDIGMNLDRVYATFITKDLPERLERINTDYPNYSFKEWSKPHHLIDVLILKDPTRFNEILKEVVEKVFNPAALFPRIDELKTFIKPYIILDKTPNSKGKYPGEINYIGSQGYCLAEWDANSEFTKVETHQYNAYGKKYWILAKYRYVCNAYQLECDPTYLGENYPYSVDKEVEFKGYCDPIPVDTSIENETDNPTKTESIISTETIM